MRAAEFIGIAAAACLGVLVGRGCHRIAPGEPPTVKVDTIVIRDTITRERPIFVTSVVYDTIRTYLTTVRHDTVEVEVPMERRVYEEDSLYRAVVSGWHPSLDTLMIWPTTTTITIREKVPIPSRSKWGIGIQAGAGATRDGLTPYVGVGVSYNLLSW